MSDASDFIIEKALFFGGLLDRGSILVKYVGPGGDVVIPEGVIGIRGDAFRYNNRITSLSIPEGITDFGWMSFNSCSSLISVNLPQSLRSIGDEAFRSCTSMTSISLPDGLQTIGKEAFCGCSSLQMISIPSSVTKVDDEAFCNCTALASVSVSDPAGERQFGRDVFDRCPNLSEIFVSDPKYLPPKYRYIAALTFAAENVSPEDPRYAVFIKVIKSNVRKWMKEAASHAGLLNLMCREKLIAAQIAQEYLEAAQSAGNAECIAMMLEYIANKLTTAEKNRASKQKEKNADTVLERKILREENEGIHGLVFAVSGNLETFKNRNEIKMAIEEKGGKLSGTLNAKVDCLILNDSTSDADKKLKADELGIEIMSERQFNEKIGRLFQIDDDKVLVGYLGAGGNVEVPPKVKEIGKDAFAGCNSITAISIPKSVRKISWSAFAGCSSLTTVTLPAGMKKIYRWAFQHCTSLQTIYIPESVNSISTDAFSFCPNLTIHAPAGSCAEAYARSNGIPFAAE